ncbi:ABC transporter ATP-binding protein [uncultured Dubosiella sp.]|uniref:ABC transporter ATP-binding protein n=2 Tax=uncultured Dubosiella sp. TaxID=1937011 RepID=UPI00261FE38A|nr:ABC transporter ATP-binding protein [uncultured Dubosiella sp.]
MIRLLRYLKPFRLTIVLIIALLFGQAWAELELPAYMQDIVDTGLQNNGIESDVYHFISKDHLEQELVFAAAQQKQTILDAYTLIEPSEASEGQKEEVPALKEEPVYFLDPKISKEEREQLREVWSRIGLCALFVSQSKTTFQYSPQAVAALQEQAETVLKGQGASLLESMQAQMLKREYESLGMDMEAMQQSYILHGGLVMLGYALISAVCAIAVGFLTARLAAGFSRHVRKDVFNKVTGFSEQNYQHFSTSTLITRTTNDVQQVQMALMMILRIVLYAPIIGIGALIHVLNSEADLTWIIALTIVVLLSLVGVLFMLVMPKFKIMQQLTDALNRIVQEILDGMPVIRAFNRQETEQEKFSERNRNITKVSLFTTRTMSLMMPLMMFVLNGTTLLILWFGAGQVDAGQIQIGSIMAFMQYSMQVIMAFLMLTAVSIMLPRANVSAQRINDVLTAPVYITKSAHPESFDPLQSGVVKFDNVSFKYPDAHEYVLRDVSFETRPGQMTALIGSTGSGKSTLVNLVPRFYDVSEGAIYVDGKDIRDVSEHDLREKIGYVPQKGMLLSGTIESNLKYASEKAGKAQIDEALSIAQAKEFVDEKPEKEQSPIAQGGTNVSGGQRQRLSIARAIMKKPEIYIFDDSFSALDYATDARLREALMKKARADQSTILVVAQRISTILDAEQIIVLDEGRVVGKGTHEQLMRSCRVYQEIALSQLSKEELGYAA